jgi:sugar phosphate isomerase/epimerase
VNEAHQLGCTDVIVPYLPKTLFTTREACAGLGRELNAYGARLRDQGIRLHYHNHGHELAMLEGATAFEHLLDAAAPENLLAQVDVYWVKVGGGDPAAYLRRLGARVTLVHLKDELELGSGPVDFPSVFRALDGIGSVKWQVVEVEKYSHPSMKSVADSLATLKSWGRA